MTDAQLRAIWDVVKLGPTTGNSQPARIVFVRSKEAKERLKPHLSPGNQDKTMTAPVSGSTCDSDSATSPVPGGMSRIR